MRLSTTLAAFLALSWPAAAAGVTLPGDSAAVANTPATAAAATAVTAGTATTDAPATAEEAADPVPSDYVAALARQAMTAHLGADPSAAASTAQARPRGLWGARIGAALSWTWTLLRSLSHLPLVLNVLLPLLVMVPTAIVVWRWGTARGRESALAATSGRLQAVRDLAAGGARVTEIARRTHMAQEGVSLAMHLAGRRPGALP